MVVTVGHEQDDFFEDPGEYSFGEHDEVDGGEVLEKEAADLGGVVHAALAAWPVAYVVAGSESGVEVADRLAAELALPVGNPVRSSGQRRDKLLMQRAVAAAGLPTAGFRAVDHPEEAPAAAALVGGYPVVIKPLRSAGTVGVSVCRVRSRTLYDTAVDRVLVQEYLAGEEYMVNSLSMAGRHRVTEVWRSVKAVVDGCPVYDFSELVPPGRADAAEVTAYVLDALELTWGPAHTEVVRTAAGPRLVETGARLQGSQDMSASARGTGLNLLTLAVHATVDPDLFVRIGVPAPPVTRTVRGVSLISPRDGVLAADLDWDRLRGLPSFHSLHRAVLAGDQVRRTRDLMSRPGAVYLIADEPAEVERDHAAIRAWEAADFYDPVRPGPPTPFG